MSVRVAINGFGRIGRAVFRIIAERPDSGIEVVAINDLADDDVLAYLLKNDSVMGQFKGEVSTSDGVMHAGGHTVQMLMERDPSKLPWSELNVDVVVEATGIFRTRDLAAQHIEAGARKVILTVPAKDEVDATVVLGVNDESLSRNFSRASRSPS